MPDLVTPLPLDQKSEKNNSEIPTEIDQSNSMILNFPVGWKKKPDLKRLEKVRGVTTVSK